MLNGGTLNNSGIFIVDSQSSFTMAAGSTVINNATGQMNLSTNTPQVVAAGNLLNNGSITMVAPPDAGYRQPLPTSTDTGDCLNRNAKRHRIYHRVCL